MNPTYNLETKAIRWITRGLRVLEQVSGDAAGRERASLYAWYGSIRQQQGKPAEAVRWCRRAVELAHACEAREALAHASSVLDLALLELGVLEDFSNSELALSIYSELGDTGGKANVLNNLGGYAYLRGRWDEALDYYERGREARLAIGDTATAATGTFNIAEILSDQGRFHEAELRAKEALRVWRAAGDRARTGFATALLGRIAYKAGRYDEAMPILAEARETFEYVGAAAQVVFVDALIAECALVSGDRETALKLAGTALERITTTGGGASVHSPLLHRIKGEALAELGIVQDGKTELEASLQSARARGLDYDVALTLLALARLGVPEAANFETEGLAILKRLGVQSIPKQDARERDVAGIY